jgi:hypothetical protein
MHLLRALLIWLMLALPASAQQTSPPVLLIDSDRIFVETL